jgi:hypothetical protein
MSVTSPMGRSSLAGACIRQWQQVYSVWQVFNDAELLERPFVASLPDDVLSSTFALEEADVGDVAVDVAFVVGVVSAASSTFSDSIALPSMNRLRCCAICSISSRCRS